MGVSTGQHLVVVLSWFGSSVVNNVYTKLLFGTGFSCPMLVAVFGMAAQLLTLLWKCRSDGTPLRCETPLRDILPISLTQIIGNVCHKSALMHTTIPVVHTVKSMTTCMTAILGYSLYSQNVPSVLAVFLMILGVASALITSTEGLTYVGVGYAATCVVVDSFRALMGKSVLKDHQSQTLVRVQMVSLAVFTPVAVFVEGEKFYNCYASPQGLPYTYLLLSVLGVAFMELSNFAYLIISTPLSHSMFNSLRCLVVVAAGILFGAPWTFRFLLGTAVAVSGVALHTYCAIPKTHPVRPKQD
eukprot:TRINITY_DN794_c0_g2_i1.p1 TRINITY_DN794_c0_g2~~TRINITY_DN794_c0_g2_i1.p1  ORF type:complete len:300 (+),score=25.30 TRINITY_DN794_c0_g2_i1:40-939(+)